ncbi:MAG: hypothetical protein ABI565_01480 [Vicinamibacteria bacterium]
MKALAIGVALLNFAPIFFLGLGLFFLAQLVDRLDPRCRRMSLAGLGLVVLGGLGGAASNLVATITGEGIPLLATTPYVFGAPGMALFAAALLRAWATLRGKGVKRDPWLVPSIVSWAVLIAAFYLRNFAPGDEWRRALAALMLLATAATCLAAGALGWRRQLHMAAGLFALNAAAAALVMGLRVFTSENIWIQLFEFVVGLASQLAFAFASWRVAAEYHARVGPTAPPGPKKLI